MRQLIAHQGHLTVYRLVIALIVIGCLIIVVIGVLLAPIRIFIDTSEGRYIIDWARLLRFNLLPAGDDLKLRLTVFGWPKEWSVMQQVVRRKVRTKPAQKTPGKAKSSRRIDPSRILGMLGTFRIRKWCIDLDTDDYITNAFLEPVFRYLNYRSTGVWRINYDGSFILILSVRNSLGRLLYAWVKPRNRPIGYQFLNLINTMP